MGKVWNYENTSITLDEIKENDYKDFYFEFNEKEKNGTLNFGILSDSKLENITKHFLPEVKDLFDKSVEKIFVNDAEPYADWDCRKSKNPEYATSYKYIEEIYKHVNNEDNKSDHSFITFSKCDWGDYKNSECEGEKMDYLFPSNNYHFQVAYKKKDKKDAILRIARGFLACQCASQYGTELELCDELKQMYDETVRELLIDEKRDDKHFSYSTPFALGVTVDKERLETIVPCLIPLKGEKIKFVPYQIMITAGKTVEEVMQSILTAFKIIQCLISKELVEKFQPRKKDRTELL